MKKLLIVDADRHSLASLSFVFNRLYDVRTAPSVEEAAALLVTQEPDIVILDAMLPGIKWFEFLRAMREERPNLMVIMISAGPAIRSVMKAMELAMFDYIQKPFNVEALRLVVARAVHVGDMRRRIVELERELARRPFLAEPDGRPMKEITEEFERALIQKSLQRVNGVQTRAARMLGTTRRILRYRMGRLKLLDDMPPEQENV